ncbi:MAG: hypothetical protein ABJA67_17155 [Chthonomonadales bacterium]
MINKLLGLTVLVGVLCPSVVQAETVRLWTKDGKTIEGSTNSATLHFMIDGANKSIALKDVLSFNSGSPASTEEGKVIATQLPLVGNEEREIFEKAVAQLTDIGLPVMTPLLKSYKDTNAHEPDPGYRLFSRIMPYYADCPDRTLDILRLANGDTLRGRLSRWDVTLTDDKALKTAVSFDSIRRFAVRRKVIDRVLDVDTLRHCSYIEFLDSGLSLSAASAVSEEATGYARLDFWKDFWETNAEGIKDPAPGVKLRKVNGQYWGALIGRVGFAGERFHVGKKFSKSGIGVGRLYFAVNDNPHWENNMSGYRVKLHVTEAYDLGDPV